MNHTPLLKLALTLVSGVVDFGFGHGFIDFKSDFAGRGGGG
jgi:hypothetical protein